MVKVSLGILLFIWVLWSDGSHQGRAGNQAFENELYSEASELYRDGLDRASENNHLLRSRLYNNLGSARYRLQDYDAASESFEQAVHHAATEIDRNRSAYNAGNSAYRRGDHQSALDHYRQSLLANPSDQRARFNYEFVKRRLTDEDQDQEPEQQPPDDRIEPSAFARSLKIRAESLVAETRYRDAFDLMLGGLQVDPSVQAYARFIDRVRDILEIETE